MRWFLVPAASATKPYSILVSRPLSQPRARTASSRPTLSMIQKRSTRACASVFSRPSSVLLSAVSTPRPDTRTPL